ncbi:MAG: apolipoprotein N-acyltransferase [Candidatus Sumerlaeota bacterium]|nr:apolipoprotein N-acyltransferase [Candidatus Sumerlaeota bacterium]
MATASGLALAAGSSTLNLGGAGAACSLWPLGFVGLAPFLWTLRKRGGAGAFRLGLWFGFVFSYATIFWLNSIWIFNYFAPVGIALLALYMALCHGLFGWWGAWLWRAKPKWAFATLPALWIFFEWFRTLGQLAFPWGFLAHTQAANLPYIQMADLAGTHIVSFCLAAINVLLVDAIDALKYGVPPSGGTKGQSNKDRLKAGLHTPARLFWASLALLASFIFVPYIYGAIQLRRDWNDGPALRVAISQPNVDQITKLVSYSSDDEELSQRLQDQIEARQIAQVREMHRAAPRTQLYVLPETSFTQEDFPTNTRLRAKLAALADEVGASIFFGEDNEEWSGKEKRDLMFVSAYMAAPGRGVLDTVYNKMRLVPFGESLPYFRYIPYLQDQILGMGLFDRGTSYTLFQAGGLRFGCGICFESAAPRHMARFVRRGAQFLAVITNDAWYVHPEWTWDMRGPAQHDSLSTFRAIENRRWVARSANTGVSRLIDPAGRTIRRLGINETGYLVAELHGRDGQTIYTRFGDWFVFVMALFVGWAVLSARGRRGKP